MQKRKLYIVMPTVSFLLKTPSIASLNRESLSENPLHPYDLIIGLLNSSLYNIVYRILLILYYIIILKINIGDNIKRYLSSTQEEI